ncbi:hypothetical protein GOODEAATRI_031430, partial [Goodea atripinnis]
ELNWCLSPQTPISWLNVYMQVAYLKDTEELLISRYPQETFTHIAEDKAYTYQDVDLKHHSSCPVPSGVLTPPLSSEKREELNGAEVAGPEIRPRMCMPSPQPHLSQ